jgi:hypothetical protein
MRNSRAQSKRHLRVAPLTPEQRYEGEKNLVHITHDDGAEGRIGRMGTPNGGKAGGKGPELAPRNLDLFGAREVRQLTQGRQGCGP